MSRVMRTAARCGVLGLALAGLAGSSITTAQAGDLGAPVYRPYPYGASDYDRGRPHEGNCRVLLERRFDPYGREIIHRIRMCDEGPVYPYQSETAAPQEYGYPPPRYYQPSPSGYEPYARPPAGVGPGYYN
jgi:hypothetical protein